MRHKTLPHFSKEFIVVLLILLLAFFFRFYRLTELQYWSTDDEIFSAVVLRMIFLGQPTLVSPNETMGFSLGSFLHLLSVPIYLVSNLNPVIILAFGSVLGGATAVLMYFTGKELTGKKTGIFAALLYSSSFLMSLADRRWWPMTLNPLLSLVAIFSVSRITIRKDTRFFLPLAIAVSFAWHADPTLAVIGLFILISLIVFRPNWNVRHITLAGIYLFISVLPLIIFELRHPGSISYPVVHFFTNPQTHRSLVPLWQVIESTLTNLTRGFYLPLDHAADRYLLYCLHCPLPPVPWYVQLCVFASFLAPLVFWRRQRGVLVLALFLGAFTFGISLYIVFFHQTVYQLFFTILWPCLFLLSAVTLSKLFSKNPLFAVVPLLLFFAVNLQSLMGSRFRYPMSDKMAVSNFIAKSVVSNKNGYSLLLDGDGTLLSGVGGLLYFQKLFPGNLTYYNGWDWIYRAHSLYETAVSDPGPELTVMVGNKSSRIFTATPEYTSGNLGVLITGRR